MDTEKNSVTGFLSDAFRKPAWLAKPWVSWMGVLLICTSAQVAAQVCEAERQGVLSASRENKDPYMGRYSEEDVSTAAVSKDVAGEVSDGGDFRFMGRECGPRCNNFDRGAKPDSPNYREALLVWADIQDTRLRDRVGRGPLDFSYYRLRGCIARHMAGQTKPTSVASNPGNPSPNSPQPAAVRPSPDARAADQLILNAATAYAQKRQADVDRARQGKPKRHVAGLEAHNCLKPGTGGGVTNACPYAVEYSYCVYHPEKDTWSASFDCEKAKLGLSVIGPGPNSRSTMHTAGETTYWFACKYGETVPKPDGVSPADIEFQLGRGLLGRCAQWGSARG